MVRTTFLVPHCVPVYRYFFFPCGILPNWANHVHFPSQLDSTISKYIVQKWKIPSPPHRDLVEYKVRSFNLCLRHRLTSFLMFRRGQERERFAPCGCQPRNHAYRPGASDRPRALRVAGKDAGYWFVRYETVGCVPKRSVEFNCCHLSPIPAYILIAIWLIDVDTNTQELWRILSLLTALVMSNTLGALVIPRTHTLLSGWR